MDSAPLRNFRMNFQRGKTETIVHLAGKGAAAQHFSGPRLDFEW